MIRRALLLMIVFACVAVQYVLPASAHHSWNGFHWPRTKNPVTVTFGDNVDATWKPFLVTAARDWDASAVVNTTIAPGKSCKQLVAGRIEVCSNNYDAGWMGSTDLDVRAGNHINAASVKINSKYLPVTKPAKRQLVICHELGHALGLGHQDVNSDNPNLGSCLDYTHKPAGPPSNEHPNKGDYDQLLCIYDPSVKGQTLKTSTHTCNGTGHLDAGMQGDDADGQPIGAPQQLEEDLYVQNLDNGHQRYTWVLWANPRAAHAGPPTGG